jgi:hypothetical protein
MEAKSESPNVEVRGAARGGQKRSRDAGTASP